jgi:threonine/homoserine/homoserine lactone efflux protein
MTGQLLIITVSVLWILLCGRFWLAIGRQHPWQRHAIALAAGLGAAMLYWVGDQLWSSVEPAAPPPSGQSDEVRIHPR